MIKTDSRCKSQARPVKRWWISRRFHLFLFILAGVLLVVWARRFLVGFAFVATAFALTGATAVYPSGPISGAPSTSRRALRWLVSRGVLLLIASLLTALVWQFQNFGRLRDETLAAVFQSDYQELWQYVSTFMLGLNPGLLVLLGVCTLGCVAAQRGVGIVQQRYPRRFRWLLLWLTGVFVLGTVTGFHRNIYRPYRDYRASIHEFDAMLTARSRAVTHNVERFASVFEGTVILVLGESITRRHMSLYGYPRDTTPFLDATRKELIVFTDAIAPHSYTVPSLYTALTSLERSYQPKADASTANRTSDSYWDLITLAQAAGFTVDWVSNQNQYGFWDNKISVLARFADRSVFHTKAFGTRLERSVFDHEMLPTMIELLENQPQYERMERTHVHDAHREHMGSKRLMVVHMMAGHFSYCRTIPKSAGRVSFSFPIRNNYVGTRNNSGFDARQVDCYDRAVRYNDDVLREMYGLVHSRSEPVVLVYVSDHGEAPLLGTGHDSRRHSHFHVEVPLVMMANTAAWESLGTKLHTARAHNRQPYSTASLFHTLAHLMGIEAPVVDPTQSLFSPSFATRPRATLDQTVGYDFEMGEQDAYELARARLREVRRRHGDAMVNKLFAHRVNTLGKLGQALDLFGGVEIDLVFDATERTFFVHHHTAKNVGLRLEDVLRVGGSTTRYWFDVKNLDRHNLPNVMEVLSELEQSFALKNRVIIGTPFTGAGMAALRQSGWLTSYYLPTHALLACQEQPQGSRRGARQKTEKCDPSQAAELARQIKRAIRKASFGALSFDIAAWPFVREHLLSHAQQAGLQLLTWDMQTFVGNDNFFQVVEGYAELPMDVIVVRFASPFEH